MLKTFAKKLFRLVHVISVIIIFLPLWPFLLFWKKNPIKNFHKLTLARKWIGTWSSKLSGYSFEIHYQTPIDWSKTYIICANHTSNLDIPSILKTCPTNFVFLGKKELLTNPVTKIFFETIDIPLDRSSKISAYKAFRRASDYLKNQKNLVIFPEGKIGDSYPPELCAFKSGPFRLAIEQGVPILPIVIQNAWDLYWDDGKTHGARPGKIEISVLKPILSEKFLIGDIELLKDETYNVIKKHWKIYTESVT